MRHTVVFKLKFPKKSPEEVEFLNAAASLSDIPGVCNLEIFREIGKKNDFDYCLSMEFDTNKEYEAYNQHPDHIKFVETYWVNYVEKFLELDYEVF
jgi:hypothetical protein